MKRFLLVLVGLLPALAGAQTSKLTALSLLGDGVQTVNLLPDRGNVAQLGEWTAAPAGSLDNSLLQTVDAAVKAVSPEREVKLFTSVTRSLFGDPATLFVDGKLTLPDKLGEAIKQSGASHLLLITRGKQAATSAAELPSKINQPLEGLGFVIDQRPSGQIGVDGQPALPVLAPFAFLRVALIDLADMRLKREQSIAVAKRLVVTRESATSPFGLLPMDQRKQALTALIDAELPPAIKSLLPK